jgi:hypothetical protein
MLRCRVEEESGRNRTRQLAAVEELRVYLGDWLGVRDDFRNWLIRAA